MEKQGRVCWRELSGNHGHGDWWPLKVAHVWATLYEAAGAKGREVWVEKRGAKATEVLGR